jgi:hypothetical protein
LTLPLAAPTSHSGPGAPRTRRTKKVLLSKSTTGGASPRASAPEPARRCEAQKSATRSRPTSPR